MKDHSKVFRITLLAASLLTIVLLVVAALRENFFAQWYRVQSDYRDLLRTKAQDAAGQELLRNFRIELKQVSIPALGAVDRCVACHNGIDDPRMTDVPLPHRAHSGEVLKHHPADRYGCTICHQGQGAATDFHDAKAEDAFWDYPLLPANLTQATCTSCHDLEYLAGKVPEQVTLLRAGRKLFSDKSCGSCHKLGGRGGTLGRALDSEGLRTKHQFVLTNLAPPHTTWRWHAAHLLDPAGIVPGSQMINPQVTEKEAQALTAYILSLRQRDIPESYLGPDKIEQKYRAMHPAPRAGEEIYRAYCAACHRPEGEGSNYANLGVRSPGIGSPDFLDVATDQFLLATLETGRPERKMPAWTGASATLSVEEAKSLVAFIRNRAPKAPSLGEVERATPNRELGGRTYQSDCAACHGERGEGTPLGSPLATSDRRAAGRAALYRGTAEGVANTAMPRYSGYDATTLRSVLDFMVSLPTVPGTRTRWKQGTGNPENGKLQFSKSCAGCHGNRGQGAAGPGLGTPGFQKAASEEFIAMTVVRGRTGTPMPAFGRDSANYPRLTAQEALDLAAFIRGGLTTQPADNETMAQAIDPRHSGRR
jgi:mono/diheme cytochrome c family protein